MPLQDSSWDARESEDKESYGCLRATRQKHILTCSRALYMKSIPVSSAPVREYKILSQLIPLNNCALKFRPPACHLAKTMRLSPSELLQVTAWLNILVMYVFLLEFDSWSVAYRWQCHKDTVNFSSWAWISRMVVHELCLVSLTCSRQQLLYPKQVFCD